MELKATDFVQIRGEEMEPIPARANPFHHDLFSMGTPLVRGWILMHEGYDREEDPRPLQHAYLVNQRSGQRIRLLVEPRGAQATTCQQFMNMFKAFGEPEKQIRIQVRLDSVQNDEERAQLLLAFYKSGIPIPTQPKE